MDFPYRRLHSGRARSVEELYLELKEWADTTAFRTLGYSLTFAVEDPGSGVTRHYTLHSDATREAIEVFLELFRRSRTRSELFIHDHAHSMVAKPCVRLSSDSPYASGFYNHCTGPAKPGKSAFIPGNRALRNGATGVHRVPVTTPHGAAAPSVKHAPDAAGALDFLKAGALRGKRLSSWDDWTAFRKESNFSNWVYYARFGPTVFAWGTASGNGARLRNSCLFHEKLTGKYDRRVDYLMLKVIYGPPEVWAFEARSAVQLETQLRNLVGNRYCFGGIRGSSRSEISRVILGKFFDSAHWKQQCPEHQRLFQSFLEEVYFACRVHPGDPSRTFHFGDSLEPGFIEKTLGRPKLIPAIEAVLRVRFY